MNVKINNTITSQELMPIPLAVLAIRVKNSCLSPFLDRLEEPPSFLYQLSRLCFDALTPLFSPRAAALLPLLFPPRALKVPCLPEPPFCTDPLPTQFVEHQSLWEISDAPPCLLSEAKDKGRKRCPAIAATARSLVGKGVLKQSSTGMIYLEVKNEIAEAVYNLIQEKQKRTPPFSSRIQLILGKEYASRKGMGEKFEIGQEMSFRFTDCFVLKPGAWEGVERAWFLTVDCPDGEELRKSYLLPSHPHGHPFFLTIAVKKEGRQELISEQNLFRLNVSCHAA